MKPFPILHLFICVVAATSSPGAIDSTTSMRLVDYDIELQNAVRAGDARCVRALLVDGKANPAADNNRAVHVAAEHGHAECVQALLADPRVDPTARNNAPISAAAYNGHIACIKLLLADPRVNPADNYPIRWAAGNGHLECTRLLLADKRVNSAVFSNTSTYWAAVIGHPECAKLLLADPRVDPNAVRLKGFDDSTVQRLISHLRACKDGDLKAFQEMNPAALSDDVLDIFISRNRPFPEVHRHLLGVQLAHLAVPETVYDDPAFETLINSARSRGLWKTHQLREVIKTFIRLATNGGLPSDLVVIIAAHSYDPIA